MHDRRSLLRGLVTLPLIGGGVTLIGRPAQAVPLVQAAALPTLDDPRQRARYAWQAFTSAMAEVTAGAHGWRILGAGDVRPLGYYQGATFLRLAEVHLAQGIEERCPDLIVESHREIALDPVEEAIIRALEPIRQAAMKARSGGPVHG